MANKRTFKKAARILANSVSESMLIVYCNTKKVNAEKVDESIIKVFNAVDRAVADSNRYFGKNIKEYGRDKKEFSKAKRAFFKGLFAEINNNLAEGLNQAMKEFNEAIPESEKEANKA